MADSASISPRGTEFDDFLFAPIGEERNGMLLSVLSALARLEIDPWQEAAKLARLPGKIATERLASLIASLPDGPSAHPDFGTIAGRLVALLPHRAGPNIPSREILRGVAATTSARTAIYVIVMVVVLGAQFIMASRYVGGTTGDAMTDDKMRPTLSDRSDQVKPEPVDQQSQQSEASATPQPSQRAAPGRRPLFRN